MRLNPEEIQNIGQLILSAYDKNVAIALELLKQHPYAFPDIQDQVLVYYCFNKLESTLIASLMEEFVPDLNLEEHPIFLLAHGFSNRSYIFNLKRLSTFEKLLERQKPYEAYIVADLNRVTCYKNIAKNLKSQYKNHAHLAIPYFRKVLQYFPEDYDTAFSLAHSIHYSPPSFQLSEAHKQEAIDHYAKAYQLYPLPNALYALGMFYQDHTNNEIKAEEYYQRCIKQHPHYSNSYNGLADLYIQQKKWAAAKEMALKSLDLSALYSGEEHILDSLGHIEWKGFQDYAAAESYFEKAIEINAQHFESIIGAADMLLEIKQYQKSIRWYKLAHSLQPKNPSILKALVLSNLELNNKPTAQRYYDQLSAILPDTSEEMQVLKARMLS